MGLFSSKCKFWKRCEWYNPTSPTCNKHGGAYYEWDKAAGCYVTMNKKEEEEKKKKKKMNIQGLQPFTKYLLVGVAVTLLSILFSWFFVDVLGYKGRYVIGILSVIIFLFKYQSYTRINLIHEKFIIFMIIEIASLGLNISSAWFFIDTLHYRAIIITPLTIGILFVLRFAALHWTKIIKH